MLNFVRALSAFRVLFGLAFLVRPARLGVSWIGPRGNDRPVRVLSRSIGGRDVALGLGAIAASATDDAVGVPAWMAAQAACDGSDLAGMWIARESLPASGLRLGALAAGISLVASLASAAYLTRRG